MSDSAPSVSLSASPTGSGRMVHLSGSVGDAAANGMTVSFSGVVSGSTTADASGNFSFDAEASGLGDVTASVTDPWGQGGSADSSVDVEAPAVSLTVSQTGNGKEVMVSGGVTGTGTNGITVNLSGVVVGTTTTDANGQYSFLAQLLAWRSYGYGDELLEPVRIEHRFHY